MDYISVDASESLFLWPEATGYSMTVSDGWNIAAYDIEHTGGLLPDLNVNEQIRFNDSDCFIKEITRLRSATKNSATAHLVEKFGDLLTRTEVSTIIYASLTQTELSDFKQTEVAWTRLYVLPAADTDGTGGWRIGASTGNGNGVFQDVCTYLGINLQWFLPNYWVKSITLPAGQPILYSLLNLVSPLKPVWQLTTVNGVVTLIVRTRGVVVGGNNLDFSDSIIEISQTTTYNPPPRCVRIQGGVGKFDPQIYWGFEKACKNSAGQTGLWTDELFIDPSKLSGLPAGLPEISIGYANTSPITTRPSGKTGSLGVYNESGIRYRWSGTDTDKTLVIERLALDIFGEEMYVWQECTYKFKKIGGALQSLSIDDVAKMFPDIDSSNGTITPQKDTQGNILAFSIRDAEDNWYVSQSHNNQSITDAQFYTQIIAEKVTPANWLWEQNTVKLFYYDHTSYWYEKPRLRATVEITGGMLYQKTQFETIDAEDPTKEDYYGPCPAGWSRNYYFTPVGGTTPYCYGRYFARYRTTYTIHHYTDQLRTDTLLPLDVRQYDADAILNWDEVVYNVNHAIALESAVYTATSGFKSCEGLLSLVEKITLCRAVTFNVKISTAPPTSPPEGYNDPTKTSFKQWTELSGSGESVNYYAYPEQGAVWIPWHTVEKGNVSADMLRYPNWIIEEFTREHYTRTGRKTVTKSTASYKLTWRQYDEFQAAQNMAAAMITGGQKWDLDTYLSTLYSNKMMQGSNYETNFTYEDLPLSQAPRAKISYRKQNLEVWPYAFYSFGAESTHGSAIITMPDVILLSDLQECANVIFANYIADWITSKTAFRVVGDYSYIPVGTPVPTEIVWNGETIYLGEKPYVSKVSCTRSIDNSITDIEIAG